MFSFFRKKPAATPAPAPVAAPPPPVAPAAAPAPASAPAPSPAPAPRTFAGALGRSGVAPPPSGAGLIGSALVAPMEIPVPVAVAVAPERQSWMDKLSAGLRKTGSSISQVFTGAQIDDALYEELETALLLADTGVAATQFLLDEVKRKVAATGATRPVQAKNILVDALTTLLRPLEKPLVIGEHQPTVIMVAGVNGAGKTTSIGKLTKHLADEGQTVLLAAADTFRAAAKEQLAIWADRNKVEIVSQAGGDPAAVSFDAVSAGKARKKDVVIVDTAGRLPTQLHLMEELRKIKRVVTKAEPSAPHEVLLVIDGNT
ncbi:MAG: ftsY, partial [Ramlibacter sp.]|nr:ftsY [Ramlibacter sp.]